MAVVKVYDQDKTEQGELTLTPEVFEVAVRPEILHLVVRAQLAAKRAGTHSTKTRAMVSGGGVKPCRAEGHRPRSRRFQPFPRVAWRRDPFRTPAPQIRF